MEEELFEPRGVAEVHFEIAHGLDHLVLVILELEAHEESASAFEICLLERHLDRSREFAAAVARGECRGRSGYGRGSGTGHACAVCGVSGARLRLHRLFTDFLKFAQDIHRRTFADP